MTISSTAWGVVAGALWLISAEALFMAMGFILEGPVDLPRGLAVGVLGLAGLVVGYAAYGRGTRREGELKRTGGRPQEATGR